MPKFYLLFFCCFIYTYVIAQETETLSLCKTLDQLNTAITNGSICKKAATEKFKSLILKIKVGSNIESNKIWIFPLAGYRSSAIGGSHGNGYYDKGYHYLDGNNHTAHPAHDIFINDKNQDNLDDHTQKPVEVLAVTEGIVIACSNQWQSQSNLRGGKYIWIYHPMLNLITYYAHDQAIFVSAGDIVKQGQKVAEVGRTGYNACKKRSPTHLHFSAFHLVNGMPIPYNCYPELIKAKTL